MPYGKMNSMETLSKLFGSNHIVKLLRLFLFNPDYTFEHGDILKRTKVPEGIVRIECGMLEKIGFIKKRSLYKEFKRRRGNRPGTIKKRISGWNLATDFIYLEPLTHFFVETAAIDKPAFLKKVRTTGNPKIVIISGLFMGKSADTGYVDLLVVGDHMKEDKLLKVIKSVEAEIGKEIRYALFSTKDFRYRYEIRDRLVRDILDFPHTTLIDTVGVTENPVYPQSIPTHV